MQPGWYADPNDPSRNLYWDGRAWHRSGAPPPMPRPVVPPPSSPSKLALMTLGGLALIAACFAFFFYFSPGPSGGSAGGKSPFVISSCQDAVKKNLRDPDNAKFGEDWTAVLSASGSQPAPTHGGRMWKASGSVNARNGFGGYNGNEKWGCDVEVAGEDSYSVISESP